MKKNIFLLMLCGALVALVSGCGTLQPFTHGPDGAVAPNPAFTAQVDAVGTAAQNLGVPYAGLAKEVWVGIAGLVALISSEVLRRKERKVNGTLIKSVEKKQYSQEPLKDLIRQTAYKDGTESDLSKRVRELT